MSAFLTTRTWFVPLLGVIIFISTWSVVYGQGGCDPNAPLGTPGSCSVTTQAQTTSVGPGYAPAPYTGMQAPTATFVPLTGVPGVTNTGNLTFGGYVNALFRLLIGLAALLAVIKIILAGIKYMGSEGFSSKGEAKEDIQNALLGLLIILSTVIILYTINPNILKLRLATDAIYIPPYTPSQPLNTTPVPSSVLVLNTDNATAEQEAEFVRNCEAQGNRVLHSPSQPNILQCLGAQTNTNPTYNTLATFEEEFAQLKIDSPAAYEELRRDYVDYVVNQEPANPEQVIADITREFPEEMENAEILFVVEELVQSPSMPLSTVNEFNEQARLICENQFGGSMSDGVVSGGKNNYVCIR